MKYGCYNSNTEEFSEKGELRHSRDITIDKYNCPEDKPLKAVNVIRISFGDLVSQDIKTSILSGRWTLRVGESFECKKWRLDHSVPLCQGVHALTE